MNEPLKPCSFCGCDQTPGVVELIEYKHGEMRVCGFYVDCDCGARTPDLSNYLTPSCAIKAWNKRA